MNRDTLYSLLIVDLTSPVTVTKPDTGDRFQSTQVINEDEYTTMVVYKPGTYTLTQDKVGTRYSIVGLRTLVDATNPADIRYAMIRKPRSRGSIRRGDQWFRAKWQPLS